MISQFDILIKIVLKLLLVIGFISVMKFWIKNETRSYLYWILGSVFVLLLSSHIFEVALNNLYLFFKTTPDVEKISSGAVVIAMIYYGYVGLKYIKPPSYKN